MERRSARPALVMVYADSAYATQCGRYFKRHGWETHMAATWAEGQKLVQTHRPRALVIELAVTGSDNWGSGLTADENMQIVLVTADQAVVVEGHDLNVTQVSKREGVAALAEAVLGKVYAQAV